jgi:UDP-2,3-diacylglucosamine pyrophosphatase LpxH
MVIELLNKYPQQVDIALSALVARGDATPADKDKITTLLKELDNIRPLLDAPSWIFMVANKTENAAARQAMENVWDACVDEFFEVPFIKEQDKFLWPDTIDMLQIALKLSSHTSKKLLEKIAAVKEKMLPEQFEGSCHKIAFTEPKVRSGEAKFVLYGHTHHHVIVSMDQVPLPNGLTLDKIYFNTGTWRKTWNRALCDPWNREFIDWHVLTYVAIFKPTENGSYSFEAWNAALG